MTKYMKEFIDECDLCSKMSPLKNFQPLEPVEVNYLFKLVSLDTSHITMPLGNKRYIAVVIVHFTQ